MSNGKNIPIRYTHEEWQQLEQAAVLAGYKHISPYIKDKSLNKNGQNSGARDSLEAWAERQELTGRLAEIEAAQKQANAMLTAIIFLIHRKATSGEFNDLRAAVEHAGLSSSILERLSPELGQLIKQLQPET